MTKRFELKLCSNGTYYVYENGTLTDIDFDKFNKESADALIDEVNALYENNEQLKSEYKVLHAQYQNLKKFVENNFNEYLTQEKLNRQIIKLSDDNKQLKEKHQKNIQFVFDTIETYSDDCFHHNEGVWSYMLNDLIEDLKNGMELEE